MSRSIDSLIHQASAMLVRVKQSLPPEQRELPIHLLTEQEQAALKQFERSIAPLVQLDSARPYELLSDEQLDEANRWVELVASRV